MPGGIACCEPMRLCIGLDQGLPVYLTPCRSIAGNLGPHLATGSHVYKFNIPVDIVWARDVFALCYRRLVLNSAAGTGSAIPIPEDIPYRLGFPLGSCRSGFASNLRFVAAHKIAVGRHFLSVVPCCLVAGP